MLNADENEAGHHIPPSGKLMEIWVVKAWNDVPEELIQKSWKVCGLKIAETRPDAVVVCPLALGSLRSLIFFFTHCILYIFEFNIVRWRGYGSD